MKKFFYGKITRRDFFVMGGIGLISFKSSINSSFFRTKKEEKFPSDKKSKQEKTPVSLVKTDDRRTGVRKSIEFLNINPFKDKNVLVKPNFNTSHPTPGSTHNDTLREIIIKVKEMGGKKISIGDRSGPETTSLVLQRKNIYELAKELDTEMINFDELGEDGYVKIVPPGSHWKDGFLVAKPIIESECIISTCCLKTHQYGGIFTMSLKNSVGIVSRKGHPFMRELHGSPDMRKMIAEINYAYKPSLIVLDGIEAFVDGGPMTGERKNANVFLAGIDRIAIDAVGLAILKELGSNRDIMERKIFEQEQISRAVELELGIKSPEQIKIITEDKKSSEYSKKLKEILYT
ncbi:MAG: DUF362 domain-containing protein [Acidobacteriota bacterium]